MNEAGQGSTKVKRIVGEPRPGPILWALAILPPVSFVMVAGYSGGGGAAWHVGGVLTGFITCWFALLLTARIRRHRAALKRGEVRIIGNGDRPGGENSRQRVGENVVAVLRLGQREEEG